MVYRIHRDNLRRKLLTDGSRHISNMLSFGEPTWCYPEPIDVTSDTVLVGAAPYYLNLPEGVSIVRTGSSTGMAFTPERAQEFGI